MGIFWSKDIRGSKFSR